MSTVKAAVILGFSSASLLAAGLIAAAPSSAQALRAFPRLASSSNPGSQLSQIARAVQAESKATFKVTYTSKSTGSNASQVTLEQKPPDQLFRSGTGEVLYDGTKTYYCSTSSPVTCYVVGGVGESPLAGMVDVYSASTYIQVMQGWGSLIAAHIGGYHISFSHKTFAGQPSACVTWSYHGSSAEYCVTDKGILAYVGGSGSGSSSSFALTSYSGSVNPSDFELPKGAKVTTLP